MSKVCLAGAETLTEITEMLGVFQDGSSPPDGYQEQHLTYEQIRERQHTGEYPTGRKRGWVKAPRYRLNNTDLRILKYS